MPFDRKEYREKNKEKIREQKKEYRKKNKEKIKEYRKEYREKNKEKIQEYREKNKEKAIEYREKNKEKAIEYHKEYQKEYRKTSARKKSSRISGWKQKGVVSDNFDALYERYISTTNCELCNCELTEDRYNTSTTRCLDHDHQTGEFRNVLCQACNLKRG